MDKKIIDNMMIAQANEISAYHMYKKLASEFKDENNKAVLNRIADDEKGHYDFLHLHTQKDVKPAWFRISFFYWIARIFGFTFAIKLMEKGEEKAQQGYLQLAVEIPGIKK